MTRVAAALAVVALAGCAGARNDGAAVQAPVRLSVNGRSSATPSVAASGTLVTVAWGASAEGRTDVYAAVSRDGGATFGRPMVVDRSGTARLSGEMPPRIAIREIAPDGVEISVLWVRRDDARTSVVIARSRDAGASFSDPVALESRDAAGARGWPALAVDATGGAHAVWLDHRGLASPAGQPHVHGAAAARTEQSDGAARAQKSSIYYATAAGAEQEIAKGVCYCCKTAIAVSGKGDVYTAWRHVYPGNLRDMAFSAARAGSSFSPPVRVSEDGWQIDGCPDDGPAMAIDASGTVHLVWPTVITGPQPRGALFHAMTRDGHTFSARTEVPTLGSIKPSHPQIAIGPHGDMLVAWDEQADGARTVAARGMRLQKDGTLRFGDALRLADGATYYPSLAAAGSGFVAAWSNAGDSSIEVVRFRTPAADY